MEASSASCGKLEDDNVEVSSPVEEPDRCGICCWMPSFLQRFAKPSVFLLAMCIFTAIDGINVGMYSGTVTSVEAHFHFTLTQLGSLTTVYCIGGVVAILLAIYFGTLSPGHRPRLLGASGISLCLGVLCYGLTSFMQDPYVFSSLNPNIADGSPQGLVNETVQACFANAQSGGCFGNGNSSVDSKTMFVFYLGSFLEGIGMAAYPIGMSYVADCTSLGTTAIYIGIINAFLGLGPVVGVLLASAFIGIWVDFHRREDGAELTIGPGDPGWIGAWWLGYLILAVLYCVSSALFWFFPRRLSSSDHALDNEERSRMTSSDGGAGNDEGKKDSPVLDVKEFMMTVWRTLKNPSCSLTCLSQSTFYFIMYGYGVFVPKYLEVQFGYDRQTADLLTGVLLAPAYAVGELLAGFMVKNLDLNLRGIIRLTCAVLTACVVGLALLMVIGCGNDRVAGVFTTYDGVSSPTTTGLKAPCNHNCSCSMAVYDPVCSDEGLTYFSPCHAGCSYTKGRESFSDCACPTWHYANYSSESASSASVVEGACGTQCKAAVPFLVILTGVFVLATFSDLLRLAIIVGSVTSESRLAALSLAYLTQVIGIIPSGQIFGLVIDSSCVEWQESCGGQGACLLYDNNSYRVTYNGLALGVGVFSAAVMFIVLLWPRRKVDRSTEADRDEAINKQEYSL